MKSRFDYVPFNENTRAAQEEFKQRYVSIEVLIDRLPAMKGKAFALQRLEESFMWVGKALRDIQLEMENANAEKNSSSK
jgi:hypothetical protein